MTRRTPASVGVTAGPWGDHHQNRRCQTSMPWALPLITGPRSPARDHHVSAADPRHVVIAAVDTREIRPFVAAALAPFDGDDTVPHLWLRRLQERCGTADDAPAALLARWRTSAGPAATAVVELDRHDRRWNAEVLAGAHRVVVVCGPAPTRQERRHIRTLYAAAGPGADRWLAVVHPVHADRPHGMGELRESVGADEVHNLASGSAADRQRLGRLAVGRGVGLVLGGGGARGFAHLGAYRALTEAGVDVDRIVGSSVGAMMGCWIALHRPGTDLVPGAAALFDRVLDYTVSTTGLVSGRRVAARTSQALAGSGFEDLWRPFVCVSTNLTSSTLMVHRHGDPVVPLCASVAVPGLFPPVEHDGDLLVDGGILNNLPVDLMAGDASIGTVIAVDVAPRRGPRASHGFARGDGSSRPAACGRRRTAGPSITALVLRSMLVAAKRDQERHLRAGAVDLLMELDLRGVRLTAFDRVAEIVARGHELAAPLVAQWSANRALDR